MNKKGADNQDKESERKTGQDAIFNKRIEDRSRIHSKGVRDFLDGVRKGDCPP
jgi:hypothetical protein